MFVEHALAGDSTVVFSVSLCERLLFAPLLRMLAVAMHLLDALVPAVSLGLQTRAHVAP